MGVTTALDGGSVRSCYPEGWNAAAKPCDCCSSAAAFMCLACDSRHDRVLMCGVCERAPAAVTCRADAAALCVDCDRDIHSANPLARRHDRVPVVPFYDAADALLAPAGGGFMLEALIPPDSKLPEIKPEFFFPDSDHFLDFDNYQICNDSLVPVQTCSTKPPVQAETRFEIDFSRSNPVNLFSVSSSSIDAGIVPDAALSESSYPFARTMSSITDMSATNQGTSQAVGTDREARVLRYKEKRKNRKFEKTIRYASRKAYAETRPRIKGRFAKKTDSEPDLYGALAGIVPSYIVNY